MIWKDKITITQTNVRLGGGSNSKKIVIIVVAIILLIVLVSVIVKVTYSAFDFSFIGKNNNITTDEMSIKLLESNTNIIDLKASFPMTDDEGIKQVDTENGNVFDFAVETKTHQTTNISYKLNIEKLAPEEGYTNLSDEEVKIYLTDIDDNKILGPVKISELDNYNLYEDVNLHNDTDNTQIDKYRIRIWIDQDVDASSWDENTKLNYKFKLGVNTEENQGKYTVTYNANGGQGQMATSVYSENTQENLRKNTFTRGGYTFKGWSTTNNGNIEYNDQTKATTLTTDQNEKNKTLYAVWNPNTYKVTYNPNGGLIETLEEVDMDVNDTIDGGFSADELNWTKDNGLYKSSTDTDGGYLVHKIIIDKTSTISFEIALASSSSSDSSGISYAIVDYDTGTGILDKTIEESQVVTSSDEIKYKKIKKTLDSGTYILGFNYFGSSLSSPTDLDRAFVRNVQVLTLKEGNPSSQTYTVGQNNKLNKNEYIKTGYTFKGWHTNKNEINAKYQDENTLIEIEEKVKENDEINLNAIWEINKYKVNVVVQNGTVDSSLKQIEYNKSGIFNITPISQEYSFATVGCTNGQTGTLKNNMLTVSNITSDTTCKVIFNDEATTTLYEDGTLIINERVKDRNSNIEKHGIVEEEYEAFSNSDSYVMYGEGYQPWYNESNNIKVVEIGQVIQPLSTAYWFSDLLYMEKGDFTNLDISNVTYMIHMFSNAGGTIDTTFKLEGLSTWDTSKVTDMRSLFSGAGQSATIFDIGDLENWNVSNVENMSCAFARTGNAANYTPPTWYDYTCEPE